MTKSSYIYGPHQQEIDGVWPARPTIRGTRHVAVAGHYLAAQAGFAILEAGGNAIDAGVAAGITEAVVESDQVNFAGVAPIMIYHAETREVVTLPGLGTWPQAASCAFFNEHHDGEIPEGLLRTVVPAAPAAWILALSRYGTMRFADVARAAIRLASEGFPIHHLTAAEIARHEPFYRRWPHNAAIYLPNGRPPEPGELFVQEDLGRTLQFLADEESAAGGKGREAGLQAVRDAFYRGDIARSIADHHRENGGLLTMEDMTGFHIEVEAPERTEFHGLEIHACGFWSQGPVLLQAANLLESFDLAEKGHNSPAYIHIVAEALKLALADRHFYYGDPRIVDVPGGQLLSKEYARLRQAMIREDTAWPEMPPPGDFGRPLPPSLSSPRPPAERGVAELDTSVVCTADRHGNVFVVSPSGMVLVRATLMNTSYRGMASGKVKVVRPPGMALTMANSQRITAAANSMGDVGKNNDFKLDLWIDKGNGGVYREGEKLFVNLKADRDCYVKLVYLTASGDKIVIFPNEYDRNTKIQGNRNYLIPNATAGFDFVIEPPFGAEMLVAFASTRPLPADHGKDLGGGMVGLKESIGVIAKNNRRGVTVKARKALFAEKRVNLTTMPRK